MSFSLVQSANATAASSCAFSSSCTSGDMIAVVLYQNSGGAPSWSVTDTEGNAYSTPGLITNNSGASVSYGQLFYTLNIAGDGRGGSNTVNLNVSATVIAIQEFSGANLFDVQANATGTGNSQDSGGATTNFANELLFGFEVGGSGQSSVSSGSGWTNIQGAAQWLTQYRTVTSTGTYHSTSSGTTSKGSATNWCEQIATFYFGTSSANPGLLLMGVG